jgi:hypothetical protein
MRYLLDYRNQQLPVTSESLPAGLRLLKIRIERLEAVAAQSVSGSRLSESCCGSMPAFSSRRCKISICLSRQKPSASEK